MAFQDFQKHCTECAYGEPCGGGHVYVLSLRDGALQVPKFRDRNPGIEHGASLYLIGWTEHVPRCAGSQKSVLNPKNPRSGHRTLMRPSEKLVFSFVLRMK